MQKMSRKEERDILNSLKKVVELSIEGNSPDDAMIKIAKEKGYSIEKIARMCEAYNKSKSVYMLTKTSSDKRAESFPLVDIKNIVKTLVKPEEQKISSFSTPDLSKLDFNILCEKTASLKSNSEPKAGVKRAFDSIYAEARRLYEREKLDLNKKAQAVKIAKYEIEQSINKAVDYLKYCTDKQLHKVAQITFNKYGHQGQLLNNLLYGKLGKESPFFEKTAKAVILRPEEPYLSISRAMDKLREYRRADTIHKYAMEKTAVNFVTDYLSNLAAEMSLREKPDVQKKESVMDPQYSNKLKRLNTTDLFYDIYTKDDFLKNQPIDDVVKAFNNVTQALPTLMDQKNRESIITAFVKKQIAEGGQLEPLEIPKYIEMEERLSNLK